MLSPSIDSKARPLPIPMCLLVGAAAAMVGLLPWMITGMRLPLQNLAAREYGPSQMPVVLLPFSQYAVALIPALLIVGAAGAGIAARATRARLPRFGFAAILTGLVLCQAVAVVQTALVVASLLQERRESVDYLTALVGLSVLSVAVGVLTLVLIARAPRAGALVGLGVAALMGGPWVSGIVVPFGTFPWEGAATVLGVTRWLPAVAVGAAIAWAGVRSAGRLAAAVLAVVALWVVPALVTAVSAAAGSRVLARDPREMVAYAQDVFGAAVTMPGLALPPVLVAVAVALLGLLAHRLVPRPDDERHGDPTQEQPLRTP